MLQLREHGHRRCPLLRGARGRPLYIFSRGAAMARPSRFRDRGHRSADDTLCLLSVIFSSSLSPVRHSSFLVCTHSILFDDLHSLVIFVNCFSPLSLYIHIILYIYMRINGRRGSFATGVPRLASADDRLATETRPEASAPTQLYKVSIPTVPLCETMANERRPPPRSNQSPRHHARRCDV